MYVKPYIFVSPALMGYFLCSGVPSTHMKFDIRLYKMDTSRFICLYLCNLLLVKFSNVVSNSIN